MGWHRKQQEHLHLHLLLVCLPCLPRQLPLAAAQAQAVEALLRCCLLLLLLLLLLAVVVALVLLLAALALLVLPLMRKAWPSEPAGQWAQTAAGAGLAQQAAAAHQAGCTGQHHHLAEVGVAAAAAAVAAAVALHLSLR
jgi:hypothetical protein